MFQYLFQEFGFHITFIGLSSYAQTDTLKLLDIQKADTLLKYNNPKLDSLELTQKSNSLKQEYAQQKEKITSLKARYQTKEDRSPSQNILIFILSTDKEQKIGLIAEHHTVNGL